MPSQKNCTGSKSSKKEIWKAFPNSYVKDKYEVSNKGNIRNKLTEHILTLNLKGGYYYCNIKINGEVKAFRVHRLVAQLFVKNPDKKNNNVVNHLDGNKLNNDYRNLEWSCRNAPHSFAASENSVSQGDTLWRTTVSGNNNHAIKNNLTGITRRRVLQYVGDELYAEYDSLLEAQKATNIHISRIVEVCKNKREHYEGYTFKYADENPNEQVIDPEEEGFKKIKTFPNYWINNKGQIYSNPFKKFMKLNKHRSGALQIQLSKKNPEKTGKIKKTILVHNLVAAYFLEKPTDDVNCIKHKDGDKCNNDVNNLEWTHVSGVQPNFDI